MFSVRAWNYSHNQFNVSQSILVFELSQVLNVSSIQGFSHQIQPFVFKLKGMKSFQIMNTARLLQPTASGYVKLTVSSHLDNWTAVWIHPFYASPCLRLADCDIPEPGLAACSSSPSGPGSSALFKEQADDDSGPLCGFSTVWLTLTLDLTVYAVDLVILVLCETLYNYLQEDTYWGHIHRKKKLNKKNICGFFLKVLQENSDSFKPEPYFFFF